MNQWARFAPLIVEEPDVIHLMIAGYYPKFKEIIHSSKVVISFLGGDIVLAPMYKPEWAKLIKEEIFQKVDCVHFVSKFLQNESLLWGGKLENSKVIYIGVDYHASNFLLAHKSEGNDRIVISTIGRLYWQKGYSYAIRAIKILKDRGYSIQYNIIGKGETFDELYYWRRILGLETEINFLGFLTQQEKINMLQSSDIYIQPSITEGLCVTVLEAMAMGLPVVASNIGGMAETIVDKVTGFLVPPADPNSLAEAMIELFNNKELRIKMGESGKKRIMDCFSFDRELKEWIELYESL